MSFKFQLLKQNIFKLQQKTKIIILFTYFSVSVSTTNENLTLYFMLKLFNYSNFVSSFIMSKTFFSASHF